MRAVIALAAFFVPLFIVVAIGVGVSGVGRGPRAHLDQAALGELRDFVRNRAELLERYALKPGQPESPSVPYLALERFDRRGCDASGQPWYRLSLERSGFPCGVLRRAAPGKPATAVAGGQLPTLVLPLTQDWAYWEVVPIRGKSP